MGDEWGMLGSSGTVDYIPNSYFFQGRVVFFLVLFLFFFKVPCCRHQNTFSEADFQTRRRFSRVVGSADTDPGAQELRLCKSS